MKSFLVFFLAFSFLTCKKASKLSDEILEPSQGEAHISDGIYMGSIEFGGEVYWSQIAFENNSYIEYASGGVLSQKFPSCLTDGLYSFSRGGIQFSGTVDYVAGAPCDPALELTGHFHYYTSADSLSFWRNANGDRVTYRLKKMIID